jgi:hypothetical protein
MTLTPGENNVEKLKLSQFLKSITVKQAWSLGSAVIVVLAGAFATGYSLSSYISKGKISEMEVELAQSLGETQQLKAELSKLKNDHESLAVKENILRLYYFYHSAKLDEERMSKELALAQKDLDHLYPFPPPRRNPILNPRGRLRQDREKEEYRAKTQKYYESLDDSQKLKIDEAKKLFTYAKELYEKAINKSRKAGYAFKDVIHDNGSHVKLSRIRSSKGGGGKGSIKFGYDGMEIDIPNELLPRSKY